MFLDIVLTYLLLKRGQVKICAVFYVPKKFIEFYRSRNTFVFVTFLDASKAKYVKIRSYNI